MSSNSKSINLAALQLFAGKAFDQETRKANGREEEEEGREEGKPLKNSKKGEGWSNGGLDERGKETNLAGFREGGEDL